MKEKVDTDRYPIDQPNSHEWRDLVDQCKADMNRDGMFNLHGFMRPDIAANAAQDLDQTFAEQAFTHARQHNIYFKKTVDGITPDHPALAIHETSNRTLCADQLPIDPLMTLYQWDAFANFLAAVMDKSALYTMADPLARVNVMSYGEGQALNWHFDRSEFTTTLLLQAPKQGGLFEYRSDLRSDTDPNYDGVARLLNGDDDQLQNVELAAGTLNVFAGKNTAHRVTPVMGSTNRVIAVFSFYETPNVMFSKEERIGFYGRAN